MYIVYEACAQIAISFFSRKNPDRTCFCLFYRTQQKLCILRSLFLFLLITAKRPSVTLQSDIIRKEKDVYIHKCENFFLFCICSLFFLLSLTFFLSFFSTLRLIFITAIIIVHCCCCNISPFTDMSAVFFRSNLFLDLKLFFFLTSLILFRWHFYYVFFSAFCGWIMRFVGILWWLAEFENGEISEGFLLTKIQISFWGFLLLILIIGKNWIHLMSDK